MDHISNNRSTCTNLTVWPETNSHTIHLQVLVGTGVGQIRYLNRALMRFDSKVSDLLYDFVLEC